MIRTHISLNGHNDNVCVTTIPFSKWMKRRLLLLLPLPLDLSIFLRKPHTYTHTHRLEMVHACRNYKLKIMKPQPQSLNCELHKIYQNSSVIVCENRRLCWRKSMCILFMCVFEYNPAQWLTISFKNACHCTRVISLIMETVCEWVLEYLRKRNMKLMTLQCLGSHKYFDSKDTIQPNKMRSCNWFDLSVFMMFLLVISIFGCILGMPISTIDWIVNWKCFANQHKHSRAHTPLTKRSKSD